MQERINIAIYIVLNISSEISSISRQQRLSVDVPSCCSYHIYTSLYFQLCVFNSSSLLSSELISLLSQQILYLFELVGSFMHGETLYLVEELSFKLPKDYVDD